MKSSFAELPDEILTAVLELLERAGLPAWREREFALHAFKADALPSIVALSSTCKNLRRVAEPFRLRCFSGYTSKAAVEHCDVATVSSSSEDEDCSSRSESDCEPIASARYVELGGNVGASILEHLRHLRMVTHLNIYMADIDAAEHIAMAMRRCGKLEHVTVTSSSYTDGSVEFAEEKALFSALLNRAGQPGEPSYSLKSFHIRSDMLPPSMDLMAKFLNMARVRHLHLEVSNLGTGLQHLASLEHLRRVALNFTSHTSFDATSLQQASHLSELCISGKLSHKWELLLQSLPPNLHSLVISAYDAEQLWLLKEYLGDPLPNFALKIVRFEGSPLSMGSALFGEKDDDDLVENAELVQASLKRLGCTVHPSDWVESVRRAGDSRTANYYYQGYFGGYMNDSD